MEVLTHESCFFFYQADNRPKLHNTPATSFFIPKLALQEEYTAIDEVQMEAMDDVEKPEKMPAILPSVGTASTIKFCERSKPANKTSYLNQRRKSASK